MVFLKQMLDKIGFREQIENCGSLPVQCSNRAYAIPVLLESFITIVWCEANRFTHTEVTRSDRALVKLCDWPATPGQDAYKRYFGKFTQTVNQSVNHYFFSWFFQSLQINYFTLDIDSTIMTRYGEQQEGAQKGYNPKKKDRKSHHPVIAFVNDVRMVANFWLRSGNSGSANNFAGFQEDTLSKFGDKKSRFSAFRQWFLSKRYNGLSGEKAIELHHCGQVYPSRTTTLATGAYFEKSGDTLKLKIALSKKRRKWCNGLWDYPIDLTRKIANA